MKPKIFIGPMSKNIVDAIIEYSNTNNTPIGIIPSRRQVENTGGYVNNWKTKDFCEYVRSKSDKILLVRDHAGPSQGYNEDDGLESFMTDCQYFDIIHVDVWKKHKSYEEGLKATIEFIKLGYSINPNLLYEVGTEEAIRPFTATELDSLLTDLKKELPSEIYSKIKYAVIQSGTALKGNTNIGKYDNNRLINMINVVNKHNLIPKEHNGDYLDDYVLYDKFNNGLQSINIAPEFGQIETKVILDEIEKNEDLFEKFYQICYDSKRWVKWVSDDFIPENNKVELINICGHYVFSEPSFIEIKNKLQSNIDLIIKNKIKNRIDNIINCTDRSNHIKILEYFNYFSNKDINQLSNLFDDDITLVDWNISATNKNNVIQANKDIFNSVQTINVEIVNISEKEKTFFCQLIITINGSEKIDVVDIIEFNNVGKIKSIKAYKG
jgi:hypothetical protein